MANSFLSLQKNIESIDKGTLGLATNLKDLGSGFKNLATITSRNQAAFDKLYNTKVKLVAAQKGITINNEALSKSFFKLGLAAGGAFKVLLSGLDIAGKIKAVVDIANAASTAFKTFTGVTKSLTFAEAINGSTAFAENLQFLEKTADKTFGAISLGLQVFTDNKKFNEFASKGVAAFADVEEAAYKLSTVTVSGSERSIDALDRNLASMKKLQKETNFALDSVTLLNAQYDIASAGFTDPTANLQVGKSAINLSQAGFGNLQGSTNAVVKVLSALGEGAESAELRSAQLFETTKVGLLTLDQLASNVGSLSSQAKQLGVSFEEVNTSLAVLTTQGISADEAATRLTSFLGDVVNVSPEASKALAQFRDEAGRPIQLNATTLKEKGIEGIIKDLKTATNGELAKIQQIFSNQTSQEFATLLIGAGEDKFSEFKGRITNVDTSTFGEEAENRSKTLKGGFSAAFNKSQAEVEKFGDSFGESVIKQLQDTNTLLGAFSTGSAEALGGFLGKLNAIQSKLSAVGGFILAAFTAVAPIAFFNVLFRGFGALGAKIGSLKREGESIWSALKRVAFATIERIEDRILKLVSRVIQKIEGIKSGIREIEAGRGKPGQTKADLIAGEVSGLTGRGLRGGLDKVGEVGGKAGSLAKSGLGAVGKTLGETGKLLGGLALGGGIAVTALSAVAGWSDTLFKTLDKSTIPELQTMSETLSSLKGVEGLDEFLEKFDQFNGKIENSNYLLSVYGESVGRLKGLFNNLTGKGAINSTIQEEIGTAKELVGNSAATSLQDAKAGRLSKEEIDEAIKANKTLITLQEQAIASEKANGGGDPAALERLQGELKAIKEKVALETQEFENAKALAEYKDKIAAFNKISTDIPINIQITSDSQIALQSQIDGIAKDFNEAFSGNTLDPQALSSKLDNIIPRLSQAFGALQTQIEVDPGSVTTLRQSLEKQLGTNLTKYLANDPALRKVYSDLLAAETSSRTETAQKIETGRTAGLEGAQGLGLENAGVAAAKFSAQTESINAQVAAINEELAKPTTSLQRQIELQSQLEQIEAKRASLSAENRIKQELSGKKQLQSLDQQILSIEQAKVNLYSQQNKFDLFSVSLARAKVAEAQKALQVAKQQTELDNRESLIKKEEAVKALESKVSRGSSTQQALSQAAGGAGAAGQATKLAALNAQADTELQAQLGKIEQTRQDAVAAAGKRTFNDDEQAQIANTVNLLSDQFTSNKLGRKYGVNTREEVRNNLFNADGSLKVPESELRKIVNANQNNSFRKANGGLSDSDIARTLDTLTQKEVASKEAVAKANEQAKTDSDAARNTAQASKDKNKSSLDAQAKQAEATRKNTERDKAALDASKKELIFGQVLADLSTRFANLDKIIALNIAQIEAEFAVREKLNAANQAIGEATSAIGTTLSSLSSFTGLGSLGAELQNIGQRASNPLAGIQTDREKALAQDAATVKTVQEQLKNADEALAAAKTQKANPETIARLQQLRDNTKNELDTAQGESKTNQARIQEETNLKIINAKLQDFSSRVETVNKRFDDLKEKLSKQVSLFKDVLDFNQKQKDNAAENNKSIGNLQTSILGFFGKNNPAANALSQRIAVKQADDDAKIQKAQATTEAKKEILDLTLQKSQLELESRGYDNALTQTQILADILAVSQGGEAVNSTTPEALARISQIPDAIKQSRALNQAQQGLIDKQLQFAPQALNDRLSRIDADNASQKLQTLGGSLNPGNVDLIGQALQQANRASGNLRRQDFEIGSLQDSSFTSMLGTLSSISGGGGYNTNIGQFMESPLTLSRELQNQTRQDAARLQQDLSANKNGRPANSGGGINQTFNMEFKISGSDPGQSGASFEQQVRNIVVSAINDANRSLSQEVLKYARSF